MTRKTYMVAFLAMAGLQLPDVGAGSAEFAELLKNSPFNAPTPPPAPPVNEPTALELRGVLVDRGEFLFSVYDKSARSSRWVALNETGLPYVIERYDSATGRAVISHRGKLHTVALPLAKASVAVLAGNNSTQGKHRKDGPWSLAAAAASWRSDVEQNYLEQLPSPEQINAAAQ
jgi:hypothetical protein